MRRTATAAVHHRSGRHRSEQHFSSADYRGYERWKDRPGNHSQAANSHPDSDITGRLAWFVPPTTPVTGTS